MREHFRRAPVKVKSKVGSPSQLVDYAAKLWSLDPDGFDEVWCVFDVDEYHRDLEQAVARASRAKIGLAISNPCFEYWLILHFADHVGWLRDGDQAAAKLQYYVPGYDKTKLDFVCFVPGLPIAIERARRAHDHKVNPSTTMWQLAATISTP